MSEFAADLPLGDIGELGELGELGAAGLGDVVGGLGLGQNEDGIIPEDQIDWNALCLPGQPGQAGTDQYGLALYPDGSFSSGGFSPGDSGLLSFGGGGGVPGGSDLSALALGIGGGNSNVKGVKRGNEGSAVFDLSGNSLNGIGSSATGRQPRKKLHLRNDSLTRIIIGSQLVSGDGGTLQQQQQQQQEQQQQQQQQQPNLDLEKGSRSSILNATPDELVSLVIDLFNMGDLDALSVLAELRIAESVELVSSAIFDRSIVGPATAAGAAWATAAAASKPLPLRGRKYVMLLWGLQLELFPDSVWVPDRQVGAAAAAAAASTAATAAAAGAVAVAAGGADRPRDAGQTTVVTNAFRFTGTRIYPPSTMVLFEYVCHHAAMVDPTLPEPFQITEDGWIIHVGSAAKAGAGAGTDSAGGGAGPGPGAGAGAQPGGGVGHEKVVELLAQMSAKNRLQAYRQSLSTRNVMALAMTESGEEVRNLPRALQFTFDDRGMIVRIVSTGDP